MTMEQVYIARTGVPLGLEIKSSVRISCPGRIIVVVKKTIISSLFWHWSVSSRWLPCLSVGQRPAFVGGSVTYYVQ